jgi:molecular chaperone GrpE
MSEENLAASDKELSDAVDAALSEGNVVVDEVTTLTADLQRLQAEYANYRKRVDRDRVSTSEFAFAAVVMEFLPVLDDLDRAAEHGELTGGFKAVADRINAIVEKLGLTKFADAPVPFNPEIHEALMHETSKEVSEPTASKILQPGYKFKDRVIRPARVAVTDPEATA